MLIYLKWAASDSSGLNEMIFDGRNDSEVLLIDP